MSAPPDIAWIGDDEPPEADTGAVAETQFANWCTRGALVPTCVKRDVFGWDFLVEYGGKSEQWRVDHTTCKVQVKGTKGAKSVRIKLDNFLRMVNEPMPWFVAVLRIDDDAAISEAHLIHVDEELIARVHQEVTSLAADAKLHKLEMRLTWNDTHALDVADRRALADRIRHHVGRSWDYMRTKEGWLKAAELYRYVKGTVSILAPTKEAAWDMLADLAIGVLDRVPVHSVEDVLPEGALPEGAEFVEAFMEISAPVSIAESTIRLRNGALSVTLHCETYTSTHAFPWLPITKVCFASPWLRCIITDQSKVRWHLPPRATPTTIATIGLASRAMLLIGRAGTVHEFITEGHRFSISRDGNADERDNPAEAQWEPAAMRLALSGDDALWIASVLSLDTSIEVDPRTLSVQRENLGVIRGLLDPQRNADAATQHGSDATDDVDGKLGAIVVCPIVALGDSIVACCGAVVGTFSKTPGEPAVSIASGGRRVFQTRVVPRADWTSTIAKELIDGACNTLVGEGHVVAITD